MEQLIKLNDQLMNAPAGVIVALFAIALGYLLKVAEFFPNKRIPIVIVIFTSAAFPILQLCAKLQALTGGAGDALLKSGAWLSIPMNFIIGVIIGFIAWTFHFMILRRIETSIPFLGSALKNAETQPDQPPKDPTP